MQSDFCRLCVCNESLNSLTCYDAYGMEFRQKPVWDVFMKNDRARNEWLAADDKTLLSQCVLKEYQASGPGGQKRNRKYSGARLTHTPSGIEVYNAESRSQNDNKRSALRALRERIALEVRCDVKPVLDTLEVGARNPRYPLLLALLMDTLEVRDYRVSDAAADLGVSTGRLSKILARDSRVWTIINTEREIRGFSKLRK